MSRNDFDDLIDQARQVGAVLAATYRDVTGEELDLESAVRHYPLMALGLALSAGAIGGWWLGRKTAPRLPAPRPVADEVVDRVRDLASRLASGEQAQRTIEYVERVRRALPDSTADEVASAARTWLDDVVEPRLREGLESVARDVSETKLGIFLRDVLARYEGEDRRLEDPDDR
jgi:hypothetical protein